MQIVNGYVCQTGCDVAAARKGHDPKNPHDDPVKAAALAELHSLATGKPASDVSGSTATDSPFALEAVRFGGTLAGLGAVRGSVPAATQLVDRLA